VGGESKADEGIGEGGEGVLRGCECYG